MSDGRIITVERETLREGGGDEWAFNRSGTKPKDYRLRFAYPEGTGKWVIWHSMKLDSHLWPEKPLIFDFESGQPIVFTSVANDGGCDIYNKYIYKNDKWAEEPLPETFEKRDANLLIRGDFDIPDIVTLDVKRKVHADVRARRGYLQIGPSRKYCN